MVGKKVASICIIIIGIIVTIPFNYIYGISGFEVDVVWTIVGIVMVASGVYLTGLSYYFAVRMLTKITCYSNCLERSSPKSYS